MMKVDKREICKYVQAYDPSLAVGEQIGRGGTAYVFDLPGTEPAQVIKIMDTSCQNDSVAYRKRMRQYFLNEIEIMKELRECKYIMPVLGSYEYSEAKDVGMIPDSSSYNSVFLVKMKRMQTLTEYCQSSVLTENMLVQMAMDICKALQICEDRHILHRDVKPGNIFVSSENGQTHFVLGDFGFCRRMDIIGSGPVTRCGTEHFLAPEVERRQPLHGSFNSDIYSLGVTLYFIASNGNFPSHCKQQNENSRLLMGISDDFAGIIQKAIQFNSKDRFQHASQMLLRLEQLNISDGKTINRPFFFSAKQAMLRDRFDEAIHYAQQGIKNEEEGCARLYAYCLYHEYSRQNSLDESKVKQAVTILDKLDHEGDAVARCIRATIHYKDHELDYFFEKIKKSAEDGCIIAQYYYARSLYDGWHGRRKDPHLGWRYLQNAAKENYLPAIKFLKRILEKNANAVMSSELACFMDGQLFDEEERLKMDIVKFL